MPIQDVSVPASDTGAVPRETGTSRTRPQADQTILRLYRPFWLLATLSFICLILGATYLMFVQNRTAIQSSEELFAAVVDSRFTRLSELALEYGYWDQAVDNLVGEVNEEWVALNFTPSYLYETLHMDGVHVLDADNVPVFNSLAGERVDVDPLQLYGASLKTLLAEVRSVASDQPPIAATGIAGQGEAFYFVAAVRMTTYFEVDGVEVDRGTDHALVFAEELDTAFLADMASDYMLSNLVIEERPDGFWTARHLIEKYGGAGRAFFVWEPDLPGSAIVPKLIFALAAVFVVMLIVTRNFFKQAAHVARSLEEARQEAERANRAKTEFIRTVTHEVRTPVSAILGFSQVLQRQMYGPLGNSKYLEYAGDIVEAGDYVLDLVGDLLDLEKIESGELALSLETIDATEALASAIGYVRAQAKDKGVGLQLQAMDGDAMVSSDPRALQQVLLNLLSNAVKFTPSGGEIVCRVFAEGRGTVAIQVADTGPGLSAVQIEEVQRPFGQVGNRDDLGKSENKRGSGLGLPIARRLTEALGGVFDFASTVGRGTTVTVILPMER